MFARLRLLKTLFSAVNVRRIRMFFLPSMASLFLLSTAGAFLFFSSSSESAWAESGMKTHPFVGVQNCRSCHLAEYEMWQKGPHANALSRLSEKDQQDPRCRSCHTMVPDDAAEAFQGIQCESCHGAGRYYAKDNVMRDADLRLKLLFEVPNEKTCVRCHTDSSPSLMPFQFLSAKKRMRHWADSTP